MMTGNCAVEYFVLTSRALLSAAALMLLLKTMQANQANATSLAPVIWNAKNPIFKSSKNDHVIEVKLFDDIDFVCPYYDLTSADNLSDPYEYLAIYMVTRREYEDCIIHAEGSATPILNCSNPHQRKRFTILFEPFQSIPNANEYQPGDSYYFITTSTGKWDGLDNLIHGVCLQRNMKLTIRVCCQNIVAKGNVNQSNSISRPSHASFTLRQATPKDEEHSLPMYTEKRSKQTSNPTTHPPPHSNRLQIEEASRTDQRTSLEQGAVIQLIDRRIDLMDVNSNEIEPIDERAAKHERLLSSDDAFSYTILHSFYSCLCFVICLTTSVLCGHS